MIEDDFDPEEAGIPYDEIAKLSALRDIEEDVANRIVERALSIYSKLQRLFQDHRKVQIVRDANLTPRILEMLEEIQGILASSEHYENCVEIVKWKKILNCI